MFEQTYNIIDIYPTIQAQGPRTGELITLIRTAIPKYLESMMFLKGTRQADSKEWTIKEVVKKCKEYKNQWVFFCGEDPCMHNLYPLLGELKNNPFKTWVDTTGIFYVPTVGIIDYLSVGPKPGLPLNSRALEIAKDIRLYYDTKDEDMWVENIERTIGYLPYEGREKIYIHPRRLEKDCISATLKYCLDNQLRFEIPLYRTVPDFDDELTNNGPCKICNILDKKE